MSPGEAVRSVLKTNYAHFSGRASRSEYWWWWLVYLVASFALSFIVASSRSTAIWAVWALASLLIIIPSLAVFVRRLHDIGRSGWWWLIAFIPLIGPIVLFVFLILDSQMGPNRWGPPPYGSRYYNGGPQVGWAAPPPQGPPPGWGQPPAQPQSWQQPPAQQPQSWQPPAQPPQSWQQPHAQPPQSWQQPPAQPPQSWQQPPAQPPQSWQQPPAQPPQAYGPPPAQGQQPGWGAPPPQAPPPQTPPPAWAQQQQPSAQPPQSWGPPPQGPGPYDPPSR